MRAAVSAHGERERGDVVEPDELQTQEHQYLIVAYSSGNATPEPSGPRDGAGVPPRPRRYRVGGSRLVGRFFQPTALTGVTMGMAMSCEETFGPAASIDRLTADAERPHGLTVWPGAR